jgi:cobalt-zinc-cadmium efflux system protein
VSSELESGTAFILAGLDHHDDHGHVDGAHTDSEATLSKRLIASLALTGLVCAVEIGGGLWTGSLALLSDAAHVFLDAAALGMSYGAFRLAARPPDARHSYGFGRAEVLAALVNAVTLLAVAVVIGKEAWQRAQSPASVASGEMLVIAALGLAANLAVAFTLSGHAHGNLNVRSAFLHVLSDALASVGVIMAALVMLATGWYAADPLASVLIGLLIAFGGWRVLRQAVHILMEGAPDGLATAELAQTLAGQEGVLGVHDLHVWNTGSGDPLLSAHLRVAEATLPDSPALLAHLRELLREEYGIGHATLQIECADCGQGCAACLTAQAASEPEVVRASMD